MKNLFKFICLSCLVFSIFFNVSYAKTEEIEVILNKDIAIFYNGELQAFSNVNAISVYPISYEGTTYLPIRSISCLLEIPIQYIEEYNIIRLGEGTLDLTSAKTTNDFIKQGKVPVTVLQNEDIKIYFESIQEFKDVNGTIVYPLSYNGTTYLPVRAVSNLFDVDVKWNEETYSVELNSKKMNKVFSGDNQTIFDTEEFTDFSQSEYYKKRYEKGDYSKELFKTYDEFVKFEFFDQYLNNYAGEINKKIDELDKKMSGTGICNTYAQLYYMWANGLSIKEAQKQGVFKYNVPALNDNRSKMPEEVLLVFGGISNENFEENHKFAQKYMNTVAAYEIKIDGPKLYEEETNRYITSNGLVFSLPGYKIEVNNRLCLYKIGLGCEYLVGSLNAEEKEDMDAYAYKNPINSDNFTYFTPIESDGINHMLMKGYSFYDTIGSTSSGSDGYIKEVGKWIKNGYYSISEEDYGNGVLIIKKESGLFNVYKIENGTMKNSYTDLVFDDSVGALIYREELNNSQFYNGETITIKLAYDGINYAEKDKFHAREDFMTRQLDIEDDIDVNKFIEKYNSSFSN